MYLMPLAVHPRIIFGSLSRLVLTAALLPGVVSAMTRVASVATGFGRNGDGMGKAVAVFGDTALAGSPMAQPAPLFPSGVVQVFRKGNSGWSEEAVLLPSDPVVGAQFGAAIALGQDIAAVGGAATYTFVRNGTQWTQTDELVFGGQPSMSGDTLALFNGVIARIYVRVNNAWVAQADLQGDMPDQGERVAGAVVDGDLAAISTLLPLGSEQVAVAEYFFARSNGAWVRETKIDLGDQVLGSAPVVALSGQTAVMAVGNVVEAFVRDNGTWTFQGVLDPGSSWDLSVPPGLALEGDTAVVGAPADDVLGMMDQGSAYVFVRSGGTWVRTARPYDPVGAQQYLFGSSVGLAGTSLVVGSPGAAIDDVGSGKMTAFEYAANTWTPVADLGEGNAHADEQFGSSIAASGTTMVVGAPNASSDIPYVTGAAYVFEAAGEAWVQRAQLVPPSSHQAFGNAVALDGTTAVIGSLGDYIGNDNEYEAVYVYTKNGDDWQQQARIGSGLVYSRFGIALGLVADTLAVGDSGWPGHELTGRVRMFARANDLWTEQATIQPVESGDDDRFGQSLAMTADTMIVGAPGANVGIESAAGAAYVFHLTVAGWQEQARLLAPTPLQDAQFGQSVALAGDTAVIGAADLSSPPEGAGAAYVFIRNGEAWTLEAALSPSGGAPATFGQAVALSGDQTIALVGAPLQTSDPQSLGVTYVFSRDGTVWSQSAALHGTQDVRSDLFGYATTFLGTSALIGAPGEVVGGSVYVAPLANEIFANGFD